VLSVSILTRSTVLKFVLSVSIFTGTIEVEGTGSTMLKFVLGGWSAAPEATVLLVQKLTKRVLSVYICMGSIVLYATIYSNSGY
jgi:hypothetical protein